MASRIERIRELEQQAEKPAATDSALRWEAAKLYWEEVTESKRSKADIARDIGKSAMHVLYMFRCWDVVVVKHGMPHDDYTSLPPFNQTYNSSEVREPGQDDVSDTGGNKPSRKRHGEESADYTTHGLVETAANAVNTLAQNKAHWPLLSEDDLTVLRAIPPTIRALLRDSSR